MFHSHVQFRLIFIVVHNNVCFSNNVFQATITLFYHILGNMRVWVDTACHLVACSAGDVYRIIYARTLDSKSLRPPRLKVFVSRYKVGYLFLIPSILRKMVFYSNQSETLKMLPVFKILIL